MIGLKIGVVMKVLTKKKYIKKKVRDTLVKKQEKCKHGASWGRNKINGTKNSPYFTFKLIT